MRLDMIKDDRVDTLRGMVGYRHRQLAAGKGNSHYQRQEVRALDWALMLIRHAAERGILEELEAEDDG
jgi:hypothetical protein